MYATMVTLWQEMTSAFVSMMDTGLLLLYVMVEMDDKFVSQNKSCPPPMYFFREELTLKTMTQSPYSHIKCHDDRLMYYWISIEGLAVGVGFGAAGKSKTASFQNAR